MRAVPLLLSALGVVSCVAARSPSRAALEPQPMVLPGPMSPAEIAARALPAIVTIRTSESLGTGFVVRSDGWVATNFHVIVGGPRVLVTLRDQREFEVVELLAASPEHDLVLVRVNALGLPTLAVGDSDAMRPGDPVVAIGNPMGLEDTVSNGLVSARRKLEGGLEVLQVSAPIATGSSGGPLLNDRGEVIGIATAVLREGQNLNFAVPARYLTPLIHRPVPMPFARFASLVGRLREAAAPRATRKVPHYPVSLLDGCPSGIQRVTAGLIGEAIDAGAPLFNDGKPSACYHVYDGAASDLLRKFPPSCKGAADALAEGRRRAASLDDPSAQAWAMRDALDGLLDVIARRQRQ